MPGDVVTDDQQQTSALAQRLFDAIELGDIDGMAECFAPDAEIWHNNDEQVVDLEQTRAILSGMVQRIAEPRYADRRLIVHPGGFVQEHVLTGTRTGDGAEVRLPCCVVVAVANGVITRFNEYFDSAHVAEFRKFA